MNYFYDKNNVRYTLAATKAGKPYNWLFIPGGPGCDSSYFLSLTEILHCSGNMWLIDFPGNGSHNDFQNGFDNWLSIFLPTIQKFENPIIVGHSFGGMLPLMFKELEDILKGLVLLNSTPCLWVEEALKVAKQWNLPDFSAELQNFMTDPGQNTFEKIIETCMPYYFPAQSIEKGREFLKDIPFAFQPAAWWQHKALELNYDASWIPQKVKTLIMGGEYDAVTPFYLFENDMRFDRENIEKALIKNAGHMPWIEEPEIVKNKMKVFEAAL